MAGKYYVPYSISKAEIKFSVPVDVDYSEPLVQAVEANEFNGVNWNSVDPTTIQLSGRGKVCQEVFGLLPDHLGVDYGDLCGAVESSVYAFADALVFARLCVQHRNIKPKYRFATVVPVQNRHSWTMFVQCRQQVGKGMQYEERRDMWFDRGKIWNAWNGACLYMLVKKSGRRS